MLAAADDRGVPVTPYAAGTSIFVEYHANHGVDDEVAFFETVVEVHDVETFEIAGDDRMAEIWRARDELAFAVQRYDPDLEPRHPGDVTVSISRYPDIVRYAEKLVDERGLLLPCFGHAGDDNVHYAALIDPHDEAAVERTKTVYDGIVEQVIE